MFSERCYLKMALLNVLNVKMRLFKNLNGGDRLLGKRQASRLKPYRSYG